MIIFVSFIENYAAFKNYTKNEARGYINFILKTYVISGMVSP